MNGFASGKKLMEVVTTRFGRIQVGREDVIRFPEGLPGLRDCRDFVLLADGWNTHLAWLQSVARPDIALPVVSPRRYVPRYQPRVARRELERLEIGDLRAVRVLSIVGKSPRSVALNLKAPLVINLQRRLGRQVIANGPLPVQYEIPSAAFLCRRIA